MIKYRSKFYKKVKKATIADSAQISAKDSAQFLQSFFNKKCAEYINKLRTTLKIALDSVANKPNVSFDDIDRELQKTAKNFVNNNKIK